MRTLKVIISRYMRLITFFSVIIILVIIIYIQTTIEQRQAYDISMRTFSQIEQVLAENQKELSEIQQSYKQTCLHNAETISRIIEGNPDIMYQTEELKEIAEITEVDEIHIFDSTGRIFAGTHPEYYNYTFDSGEQMNFFKPMLKDKSLQLVQDITPNTAEGKMMQYSALWSKSGDFIVQVGMEPVSVMKVTAKNELSYIFSLFRVNPGANYYAIDAESQEIVGSTISEYVGEKSSAIGLNFDDIKTKKCGFFDVIDGEKSYCVFKKIGDNYIGRTVLRSQLYQTLPTTAIQITACLAVIALILSYASTSYINKYVVERIHEVNGKLYSIANGNLDETIDIQSSREFSELSNYLNSMIKSLLDNNKKMSYVLSKTNRYIGVYEYSKHIQKVRFTEYVPLILALDAAEMERLSSDYNLFKAFIDNIRKNPVPDETGVYKLCEQSEQYVSLEESNEHNRIFGVVIDVTNEITRRKAIEFERDIDSLTGLYNRRGLDIKLSALFKAPEKLGYSAFIMIDADGLKIINDTYGHAKGDIYLKNISQIINNFGPGCSVAARQSGDEFILFLYQYEDEEELLNAIHTLERIQDRSFAHLDDNTCVPLSFSLGYSLTSADMTYTDLIKKADKRMYENKRKRKSCKK